MLAERVMREILKINIHPGPLLTYNLTTVFSDTKVLNHRW